MNRPRTGIVFAILTLQVALIIVSIQAVAARNTMAAPSKIDSSLALLYSIHTQRPGHIPKDALDILDADGVKVNLKTSRDLSDEEEASVLAMGILPEGRMHRRGRYCARMPWKSLLRLAEMDAVDSVECKWSPSVLPCLDVSASETGATAVWSMLSQTGVPITGQGIVVADFDTGVDVFHPGLWRADGGVYNWIDVNGNGVFDKGVDAVDLNRNGTANTGEILNYFKGSAKDYVGAVTNSAGTFLSNQDWLYNDANGNGTRDYGVAFGESAPTFGERVFIVQDTNGNHSLDPGESLLALGTSKIAATLCSGGITRTRGSNLISTPADTNGHGTSVCGILCGETPGFRKYVGLAPGIDLLLADRYANSYTSYIPWAEQRGARVMLYEFGAWTYQFMDGSSTLEQMMDAEAAKGIVQVAPAGNLANVKKHASVNLNPGQYKTISINVGAGRGITSVYVSVIWSFNTDSVSLTLTNPSGATFNLPGDTTFRSDAQGNSYWSNGPLKSPRGTRRVDINFLKAAGVSTGNWKIGITNNSTYAGDFHAYVTDNLAVWSGGAYFQDNVDTSCTTTWPATANSALVVGSYSDRGISVKDGALSPYSGEGPYISAADYTVDLCAPGNSDVFTICSKDAGNPVGTYREFGGTSSSSAHVAAAAALILQANPSLKSDEVSELIFGSSATDSFTGQVPDMAWGYGKLSILPAVQNAASPALESPRRLKQDNPDGVTVRMWGKVVVAVGNDGGNFCYVEEPGRSSGMKIVGYSEQIAEGDKIEVTGTLETVNGERQIRATSVRTIVQQQKTPGPVALNGNALGGSSSPGCPGVADGIGMNNIGLLVTSWGFVRSVSTGRFYLDGAGSKDIGVACAGLTAPPMGKFVVVTGISSVEIKDGLPRSMIRARRQADITVLN